MRWTLVVRAGSFLRARGLIISNSDFIDMIRRRSLRTRAIKMLVLDEADEMLNKGRRSKSINFLLTENSHVFTIKLRCGASELF